jgi:hypothetical protein
MMTLAVLRALGFSRDDAIEMIQSRRNVVDFADVYVESVEDYIRRYHPGEASRIAPSEGGNGAGRAE